VDYQRLLLVPKAIARINFSFSSDEYFRHYLLPQLQKEELAANSGLVELLKDGRRRVTKKSLVEKYGAGKLVCVDLTIPRTQVLDRYRSDKRRYAGRAMTHDEVAEAVDTEIPDWDQLLQRVLNVIPGRTGATEYENAIEALLTALFYPALIHPFKQHPIHQGRKRVDITYANAANSGFFHWIGLHHPSAMIFIECKNYGKEIGNPELDQISGRFSPNRGKAGLLFCRSLQNAQLMEERCRDTADDHRGFVIVLDDERLTKLVTERKANPSSIEFPLLRQLFTKLIT
jgi:hypothetical protein